MTKSFLPSIRLGKQKLPLILSYQSTTAPSIWKWSGGVLWKFPIDLHMWQSATVIVIAIIVQFVGCSGIQVSMYPSSWKMEMKMESACAYLMHANYEPCPRSYYSFVIDFIIYQLRLSMAIRSMHRIACITKAPPSEWEYLFGLRKPEDGGLLEGVDNNWKGSGA